MSLSAGDYEHENSVNPAFLARLQKDPSGTVQRIQKLYNGRVHGAHNETLCKHVKWLAQALDSPKELSNGTWRTLMDERLFDELYFNVLLAPDFFEEESTFVTAVINGLTNLAKGSTEIEDTKTAKYMLTCCSVIFKAIWDHRDRLKDLDTSPAEGTFEWCVFHWSDMHQTHRGYMAGVYTYIPHVVLFSWVHLSRQDGVSDMALAGMRFLSDRGRPVPEHALSQFIEDVVLDSIGGDSVFARFERTLHEALEFDSIDFLGTGEVLEVLGVMSQLIKHPKMRAFVQSRETFRHTVAYLDRLIRSQGDLGTDAGEADAGWTEWEMSLFLFELVTVDLKNAHASSLYIVVVKTHTYNYNDG